MPKKGYKDIKEEVIVKRTGRNFDEWMRILERFNVKKNGHQAAAKYLMSIHRVNPWWAQVIVVRYEHENNLKK